MASLKAPLLGAQDDNPSTTFTVASSNGPHGSMPTREEEASVQRQRQGEAAWGSNGAAAGGGGGSGQSAAAWARHWDIVRPFAILGWTAFGGPTAHVALYHKAFVETRHWLTDAVFAEILALCQMLPGPSSAQFSFSLGVLHAGPTGGLLSGVLFLTPGLLLLTLSGLAASHALHAPPHWLLCASSGLVAVAVALVAQAALALGNRVCKTTATQLVCCACAAIAFSCAEEWIFPVLILAGGATVVLSSLANGGWQSLANSLSASDLGSGAPDDEIPHLGLTPCAGASLLVVWASILAAAVAAKQLVPYASAPALHWFEAFFVTGSVAYGGGQVILPFLQNVVVQYDTVCPADPSAPCVRVQSNSTWVTEQEFLTGLGVAQAMPGPLFNFSAYLGACINGLPGALVCWLGLFSPGVMALYAALPFWSRLRRWALYRHALPGFNAAAVGLIYATVFQLGLKTYSSSPFPVASVGLGMLGFGASAFLKVPAPLAIVLGAFSGVLVWAYRLLPT